MKNLISLLIFLISFSVSAKASDSYLQGFVGFDATAINFGVDYEIKKASDYGLGGYFFFSSEEENASSQVMSFGGMVRLHIHDTEKFDVSLAPGFGISMVDFGTDDETILGPTMKIGILYKLSNKSAIGVEVFQAYNWLNNDVTGTIASQFFSAAYRFKL